MNRQKTKRKNSRLRRYRPQLEALETRRVMSANGLLTAEPAYLTPSAPGIEITPLLTVGDTVTDNYAANDGAGLTDPYRMVGIPDGMGAFDNGDGTFTVLLNHELGATRGIVRDHGSAGAFVSRWVIDKATLEVLEGDDLIKSMQLWSTAENDYIDGTTAINRLCSGDLPEATAFFNEATGLGTTERIFMSGEESSSGRAFAHVISTGESWELPALGKFAWENSVASPTPQDKTIVMGLDDSSRSFSAEGNSRPSELYIWIGEKQDEGSVVEKAGLVHGVLNGLRVIDLNGDQLANESTITSGQQMDFEVVPLNDQTNNETGVPLQDESIEKSITQFRRIEDGHFDPTNPNVFYFVTTDRFEGNTRLWKLTFDDITNPDAGGVIEIAFDSPSGVDGEMFDNMTVNANGDVLIQEDPGGNGYLAKIWQYNASSGDLVEVAHHNEALFGPDSPDRLTINEESSGIIDLTSILGDGYYLANVQAHYGLSDPELVEGGQLLVINTNIATATLDKGTLQVQGTINDDEIFIDESGSQLVVYVNGEVLGQFKKSKVDVIEVHGGAGNDHIELDRTLAIDSVLRGGLGNDTLYGANGRDQLFGDEGDDHLFGRNNRDLLVGGLGDDELDGGNGVDQLFEHFWSRRVRDLATWN